MGTTEVIHIGVCAATCREDDRGVGDDAREHVARLEGTENGCESDAADVLELGLSVLELVAGLAEGAPDPDQAALAQVEGQERRVIEEHTRRRLASAEVRDTGPGCGVGGEARVEPFHVGSDHPHVLAEVPLDRGAERLDVHRVGNSRVELEREAGHAGDLREVAAHQPTVPVLLQHPHQGADRIGRGGDHVPLQGADVMPGRSGHVPAVIQVSLDEVLHGDAITEPDVVSLPLQGREPERDTRIGDQVDHGEGIVLVSTFDDGSHSRIPMCPDEGLRVSSLGQEDHPLTGRHVRPFDDHPVSAIRAEVGHPVTQLVERIHDVVARTEGLHRRHHRGSQTSPHLALPHPGAVALRGRTDDVLIPLESSGARELLSGERAREHLDLPATTHMDAKCLHGGVVFHDVTVEAVAPIGHVDRVRAHADRGVVFEKQVEIPVAFSVHQDGGTVHHESPVPVGPDSVYPPKVRPVLAHVVEPHHLSI